MVKVDLTDQEEKVLISGIKAMFKTESVDSGALKRAKEAYYRRDKRFFEDIDRYQQAMWAALGCGNNHQQWVDAMTAIRKELMSAKKVSN